MNANITNTEMYQANQTIINSVNTAGEPLAVGAGALPQPWRTSFDTYCRRTGCNFFTPVGMTVMGCSMLLAAIILEIVLLYYKHLCDDNNKRASTAPTVITDGTPAPTTACAKVTAMRYYRISSTRFVGKFLALWGYYFLLFGIFVIKSDIHDNDPLKAWKEALFIESIVFMVFLIAISTYQYLMKSRYRNSSGEDADDNNCCPAIRIKPQDVFQDLTGSPIKAIAVGITQGLLIIIFAYSIAADLGHKLTAEKLLEKDLYLSYTIASLMQATYNVGVNDIFQNVCSQTTFWLETFNIYNQNIKAIATKSVFISREVISKDHNNKEHGIDIKISKVELIVRCFFSCAVNIFGESFITVIMPWHLALSDSPANFVLNATALYVILDLDNLSATVTFWLNVDPSYRTTSIENKRRDNGESKTVSSNYDPKSKRDSDDNEFEYKVLFQDKDMGYEIRSFPMYSYVEYHNYSTMKIAMNDKKPLPGSYRTTYANVENPTNTNLCITNIVQPIVNKQEEIDTTETTQHHHSCDIVVAVANLDHPNFDRTFFNPTARLSETLYNANAELRCILQERGFNLSTTGSSMSTSSSHLGEKAVVFAERNKNSCNRSSSSSSTANHDHGDSVGSGEVWIYLNKDDKEVQRLLLLSDSFSSNTIEATSISGTVVDVASNCYTIVEKKTTDTTIKNKEDICCTSKILLLDETGEKSEYEDTNDTIV